MFRNTSEGSNTSSPRSYGGRYRGSSSRGGRGGFKNGYHSGGGAANTKEKGLFADGVWHCECTPRLPAEHFRVKKEGKNHGRWFYTCQNAEPRRCGFFLWDEDAKPREEAAVLGNSRSEPGRTQDVTAVSRGQHSPSRTASPTPAVAAPSLKRKASFDPADEDEEFFPWPLTGAEEASLASATDTVTSSPETPRKAVKTDAYATPVTSNTKRQLPWLDYETPAQVHLPTPTTTTKASAPILHPNEETPTPSRFKDALAGPSSTGSELVTQVFNLLDTNTKLEKSVEKEIRAILVRHEMKIQGVVKGREITRLGLRAKEAKIVELSARIAALEAEREVDRGVIQALKSRPRNTIDEEDEEEDEL